MITLFRRLWTEEHRPVSSLSHAENLPPRKLKLRSRKLCVSFGVSQTFPGYVISMLRKQSLQWRKVA